MHLPGDNELCYYNSTTWWLIHVMINLIMRIELNEVEWRIYASVNLIIIGSDNGLLRTAPSHILNQCWNIINWTPGNKLQWNLNQNCYVLFKKMHLTLLFGKWQSFCFGLDGLTHWGLVTPYDVIELGHHWCRFRLMALWHWAIT